MRDKIAVGVSFANQFSGLVGQFSDLARQFCNLSEYVLLQKGSIIG